jgi:hypothetical protein
MRMAPVQYAFAQNFMPYRLQIIHAQALSSQLALGAQEGEERPSPLHLR